jgi:sugar phosphate isomerase/epimerase
MAGLRANAAGVADRLAEAGCDRIVVPSMPEDDSRTVDDVRRFAAELGRLAPRLADRGFRLAYHNHDFEFAPLDGTTAWDVLLAELPPGWTSADVYWSLPAAIP